MIYHVESENEGCNSYSLHISCNMKLAYDVLMDITSMSDDRRLTIIHMDTGKELSTFWASKNPSYADIRKGVTDATASFRIL